jgi:hypothetical protein
VVRPRDSGSRWAVVHQSTLLYSALGGRAAWAPLLMEVTVPGPRGSGLPDRLDLLAKPAAAGAAVGAGAGAAAAAAHAHAKAAPARGGTA